MGYLHPFRGAATALRRTVKKSDFPPGGNRHGLDRRLRLESLEVRQLLAITVTTLVDENNGVDVGAGTSLREAIAAAPAGETILFAPTLTDGGPATILLTRGELQINKNLTINGPGAALLTIDASGNDATPNANEGNGSRVFNIDDFNASLKTVAISHLRLTGGDSSGSGGGAILVREHLTLANCVITGNATFTNSQLGGGGIYSAATSSPANSLTLLNCSITNNAAVRDEGGGIRKRRGSLTIEGCTFSGNTSFSHGGGMSVADELVQLQIRSSTFTANTATNFYGGGIFLYSAVLTMADSTLSGNSALAGGAIYMAATSRGTVSGCTLNDNVVNFDGGGIYVISSQLTVTGSTLSNNSARNFGGGAVAVSGGSLTFRHSTVTANRSNTDNTGGEQGGGIILGANAAATLDHTIVAGNTRGASSRSDAIGTMAVRASVIGDGTGLILTDNGGNLIGSGAFPVNPLLGPLADNGGPTKTHALLPGSQAINAGAENAMSGQNGVPALDQRGPPYARVVGGRIDVGAFELQPIVPPSADFDSDNDADGADFLTWQRGVGLTAAAATQPSGNADLDNDVDGADLAIWRTGFGAGPAMASAEPSAAALLAAAPPPLSPEAVDAAMAYQQLLDALPRRPLFRPRWRFR